MWLTDPELFLYAKATGNVQIWRCKNTSSTSSASTLVVPMKPDDFDYEKDVKNHMDLIFFEWDESDYKRLVKYILERHLLVNSQGLVIAEIHKDEEDGNKVPMYIRSLDVISLKSYIPKLIEQPIPLRTVRILDDANGKAATMMEQEDSKLSARIVELEGEVTKLKEDLATQKKGSMEVWMNHLTNSEWVGIGGLKRLSSVVMSLVAVGQKGSFTEDDDETNVLAGYKYYVRRYGTADVPYVGICLGDLTPNNHKARFNPNIWRIADSDDRKSYALR